MEKIEVKPKATWHDIEIKGRWRLIYAVGNSQGPSAFGGYHLSVYPNPFTGQQTYLKNVDGKALNGYLIDKIAKVHKPDEDPNTKYLISWLIAHPEVNLEGIKDVPEEILKRKLNGKITLIALDQDQANKFEEEDYQDKLVGLLSLDHGKNAVGIEKLRHILAYLNMTYFDSRYEGEAEKKALRSKLKSYVRDSYKNAQEVNKAIDDIKEAQSVYEFKEMVRLRILDFNNNMFKFNSAPLGSSYDTVRLFFENHPEIKAEALSKLYSKK